MSTPSKISAAIFEALAEGRLNEGHLWSPPAVGGFTGNQEESRWFLTAKLQSGLVQAMRSGWEAVRSESAVLLGLAQSTSFWVLVHHIGRVQHRLFLPLVGATVGALVQAGNDDVRLYLSDGETGKNSFATALPLPPELRKALQEAHTPLLNPNNLVQELLLMTAKLLEPDALEPPPCTETPAVVHVTCICPPEAAGWLTEGWRSGH